MDEKNAIFENCLKNKDSNQSFEMFQSFHSQLSSLIVSLKKECYSKVAKRLLDPSICPETYCFILKTILNNKKLPVILPISHDNKFITVFKEKAEIFNSHFSKQCTPLVNKSKIPSECPEKSIESFSSITFEISDVDPNKSHGYDMLSIHMLKLCGESIYKPLTLFHLIGKKLMSQFLKRVASSY